MTEMEVWTAVSWHGYSKASNQAPTIRRLYHHLAILAQEQGEPVYTGCDPTCLPP